MEDDKEDNDILCTAVEIDACIGMSPFRWMQQSCGLSGPGVDTRGASLFSAPVSARPSQHVSRCELKKTHEEGDEEEHDGFKGRVSSFYLF